MVDWQAVNLGLSILVKIVFLGIFAATIYVLKNANELVESAERSAESIEQTAEDIGRIVSVLRMLPFTKPKGGRDE
ncbi:MAG: hypothetical protein ABEK16_02550 [Candidatus Nanohalobium sp.]